MTGEGVDRAVRGAGIIIHCAGAPSFRRDQAMTANLIQAARQLPAPPHLVKISVVGADRVPVGRGLGKLMFGYFESMVATERAVERSGLPWTTLRATQFFDAVALIARAMARLPLIPVPSGIRFQPVDTGEVADRLIELAVGAPAGLAPDFGGPTAYPMADLVRSYLRRSAGAARCCRSACRGRSPARSRTAPISPPPTPPWATAPGRSSWRSRSSEPAAGFRKIKSEKS